MTIINVRGPCGAGKSHLVRAVLDADDFAVIKMPRRNPPVGYVNMKLFIAGHYETAMGGIDSFGSLEEPYKWIKQFAPIRNVLFEGKCQENDLPYLLRLKKHELIVVNLKVTPRQTVKGVQTRPRANKIREANILRSWRKNQKDLQKLTEAGITVHDLPRPQALNKVLELLKCC
jgi:hypothetical protein